MKELKEIKGMNSDEIYAAIAMAIYETTEAVHDYENPILTIRDIVHNYSPWGSKVYSLRELPRK